MLISKTIELYKNQLPLSLLGIVKSDNSRRITLYISELIRREVGGVKSPSTRLQAAVAALISDLLTCASTNPDALRYRSVGGGSFGSEPVGYRAFRDAYDTLVTHGYIEALPGKKGGRGGVGAATRMRATSKLIALASSYEIELYNLSDHFGVRPPSMQRCEPVVMSAPATKYGKLRYQGKRLRIDNSHPGIIDDTIRINKLNEYLSNVSIFGIRRWKLQRVYCDQGDSSKYGRYGGRLYSPFQNIEKEKRKTLEINSETTCEIDIGASFLTIYHSLYGKPLDTTIDPYDSIPLPRPVVKAYINAAFGHGQFHARWPNDVIDGLENPKDADAPRFTSVKTNFPIARVRMAVENRFPALALMGQSGISWGDLHYAESEVVLATMETLAFERDIPSLPMHDAIIVPVSKATEAMRVLSAEFEQQIGVKPKLTIKGRKVAALLAA